MLSRDTLIVIYELFRLANFQLCDSSLDPSGNQALEKHVRYQRALAETVELLRKTQGAEQDIDVADL
jgi:hypothetical protein